SAEMQRKKHLKIENENSKAERIFLLFTFYFCLFAFYFLLFTSVTLAQNKYEDRQIVEPVDITFEGNDRDLSAAEEFRLIAHNTLGEKYSSVKIREAIQAIYNTNRIISV